MKNRKGFEFGFGWMFAMIVGAFILFLAIYGTTRLVSNEREVSATESAREFGILLNPVSTGLEEGKITKITFIDETRVYNTCKESGGRFGSQQISLSMRSDLGQEWPKPGIPSSFKNKYLFSEGVAQAKSFEVFSKPFRLPYSVADLNFLLDKDYCFVNPPLEIEEEINGLNPARIKVSNSVTNCSKISVKVCFAGEKCDVEVNVVSKSVKKGQVFLFYEDSLIYGAIFASPEVYECQVKRIMKRANELAEVYRLKSEILSTKGCSSNLEELLVQYGSSALKLNKSLEIKEIALVSEEIGRRNELLSCRLF